MSGAGEALQGVALAAVAGIEGLNGAYPGPPVQAVPPYAIVETGPETDWGHKNGSGRELRLAVIVRDEGEAPMRARALAGQAERAIAAIGAELSGWRVVSLAFLRARTVQDKAGGWAAVTEWRARMLAL